LRHVCRKGSGRDTPGRILVVRGVDLVNRRGKSVGVRLVKLTGKRLYHMPFTPERVQQALKT